MTEYSAGNRFSDTIADDLSGGRILELAELYALDALTEKERAAVDSSILAASSRMQEDFASRVRQARETLARSYAAEAEPPDGLLGRILGALPVQQAGEPDTIDDDAPTATVHGHAAVATPSDDELGQRREARRRRRTPGRWIAAGAAAAIIAVGGVAVGTSIQGSQNPVQQILNASDVISKQVAVADGTATLRIAPSKDAAVVTMHDVPPPPAGKVYQMWLIPSSGAPVSQGTMDAAALSRDAMISGVNDAKAFAITVEPAGGSVKPTLPVVVSVPLTS